MKKITILLIFLTTTITLGQKKKHQLLVLKTNANKLTIAIGEEYYPNRWSVDPKLKLDVFDVPVKGKSLMVKFISDIDSIEFLLSGGTKVDFIVLLNGKDSAFTQINAQKYTNPATFNKAYIKANNLKTLVEIPPIYELVNIVIALTESAAKDKNLIYKKSPYYEQVMAHFSQFKNERVVHKIDTVLQNNKYAEIKMDGYSFELKHRRIKQSQIYDRVSWGSTNLLRPYIKDLQEFADKSGFVEFFEKHQQTYDAQIHCYHDTINTTRMITWLRKNFPNTDYDCFKIIFSPLVAWNQSANRFESNGFKEAQAHVNFPYIKAQNSKKNQEAINLNRGSIVFTELNHSFINPELEKYQTSSPFLDAFKNLDAWNEKNKPAAGYNSPGGCANEYMNWALVSLYYTDFAPEEEVEKMISDLEINMKKNRGFKKFPEFNQFLIHLYKTRANKTVADLYPQIVNWFFQNK